MDSLIHYELTAKNYVQRNLNTLLLPVIVVCVVIFILTVIKLFRANAARRREFNRHFPGNYHADASPPANPGEAPVDTTSNIVVSKRFK